MKIFVVGLPLSGKTTVSKALAKTCGWSYVDVMGSTFREPALGEHPQQYQDEYYKHVNEQMMATPNFILDAVQSLCKVQDKVSDLVIDGLSSPRDFISLFDYNKDIVIFLNRTDNVGDFKDQENIGVSVIRDYCFWMSSAGLLSKDRWLEYNFKIPGEDSNVIKTLGSKNSVFIVKSIHQVISHLLNKLNESSDAKLRVEYGIFS